MGDYETQGGIQRMIREIKEELEKGPTTVDELARKLGVSKERVEDALRLMVEMGIIEEVVPASCTMQKKGITCSFCPLKDKCGVVQYRTYKLKKRV